MKIIDAHHHLWNPDTNMPDVGYVWLRKIGAMKPFGDPTPIQRDYMFDEFLTETKAFEIVASVHVQSDGAIADPVRETGFVHNIADTEDFPIAIVGFVDLTSDNAAKSIERHRGSDHFRGVRQILSKLDDRPDISFAGEHYISNEKWRNNFSLLAEYALSFDLQCYPEQMPQIAEFLALHPNVPIAIDHAGSPYDSSKDGMLRWTEGMRLLAQLPQVSAKLSGFGMFDRNWSAGSIQPLFESMYEAFGPKRLMFGSNFPVDKLMRNYDEIAGDIVRLCNETDDGAAERVMCKNAASFYGIDV